MKRKEIFLLFLFLFFACIGSRFQNPPQLPSQLAGLALTDSISGEKAAHILRAMHDEKVAPQSSVIGVYGGFTHGIILYMSRFTFSWSAKRYLGKMATAIGTHREGFFHHKTFHLNNNQIHFVWGGGKVHYFFHISNVLYWIEAPPQLSRQVLAQILKIPPDIVPTIHQIMQLPDWKER